MDGEYSVTQSAVTQLLTDVKSDRIAIPELQRPFVWDSIKIRDLMEAAKSDGAWSRRGDSNPQPLDYKSSALPVAPRRRDTFMLAAAIDGPRYQPPRRTPAR